MLSLDESSPVGEGDIDSSVALPPEVLTAIDEILPSDDPLHRHDFDVVAYINQLFPSEHSLTNIDDVMASMVERIRTADTQIRDVVRGHTHASEDGRRALYEAQKSISQLSEQLADIESRARQSERSVHQITRHIQLLDRGKRNLTAAVTTLNHLHMLSTGVDTLQSLISRRQYEKIALLLEGVMKVLEHFDQHMSIAPIKELSDQVHKFREDLAHQIDADFRGAFAANSGASRAASSTPVSAQQLAEACLVVDVLQPSFKRELLGWLVDVQLCEYRHLFGASEACSWLDCVDRRYDWLKHHLVQFEQQRGRLFPPDWELSERIAVEFCRITRRELASLIARRVTEVDVKLLLFAIQKTVQFELLMSRRFTGATISAPPIAPPAAPPKQASTNPFGEPDVDNSDAKNPFLQPDDSTAVVMATDDNKQQQQQQPSTMLEPFQAIISGCFEPHLNIYVESQDRNLRDLLSRFVGDLKSDATKSSSLSSSCSNSSAVILPSCADLFMLYKKSLVQCSQLTRGAQLLSLAAVFRKYLRQYAGQVLLAHLPRHRVSGLSVGSALAAASSVSTSTTSSSSTAADLKEQLVNLAALRDMASASSLFSNIHSVLTLKDSDVQHHQLQQQRLSPQQLSTLCSVLMTAEYCDDTTRQLSDKVKQKVEPALVSQVDFSAEQEVFLNVIGTCVQILVQELELACEPALIALNKMSWQSVESVGDQSVYVTMATTQLKQLVPVIREHLANSRKYFTDVCVRFANVLIPRFMQCVSKCRGLSTVASEQLLLDAHSLKTALLVLPSVGSQPQRSAPASYTRVVVRGMTRVEMLLKVVMSPHHVAADFIEQYRALLPDSDLHEFTKILDIKGVRRAEQVQLTEAYRNSKTNCKALSDMTSSAAAAAACDVTRSASTTSSMTSPDERVDNSTIQRLEKIIKKHM